LLAARGRVSTAVMHLPAPKFPPLFTGHAVHAPLQPLTEACRGASAGTYGAGDIVWGRATERMALALVLEPDVPLATAYQMSALAHVAVAETLGHLCPPQIPVMSRWPDTVLVNSGACGTVTLAAPSTDATAIPAWLVVGIELTIAPNTRVEPGERPHETSLDEEGSSVTRTDLIEALSTRLLAWLHTWQTDGFRPIHDQWLFRTQGREADIVIEGVQGRVLGLDDNGNLVLKPSDGGPVRLLPFAPHVRVPHGRVQP
jgi:BirA family transcriptional regulator, biotin operon repressor / biotin---[acetyl-CoA-carboxylase] ligase